MHSAILEFKKVTIELVEAIQQLKIFLSIR